MMKRMTPYLMLCVMALNFACRPGASGTAKTFQGSTGIINGKPVQKSERVYKMTARLLRESKGVWYPSCTASILATDLILTAAHCVEYEKAATVRVGFDVQPLTYKGQDDPKTRVDVVGKFTTAEVENFIVHPLYHQSEYDQDMALIRIKGSIPKDYVPVPLLSDSQWQTISEQQNYQVLLVGYGLLREKPLTESEILREAQVSAKFEGDHVVTNQTQGFGGCNGDSGGPAYLDIKGTLYLVGVTHGPTVDATDCHHRGVWGNPSLEKSFLNESAEKMGSSARF